MLPQAITNISWAVIYVLIGAVTGSLMVIFSASLLPRLIDRLTPAIDEEKEILRGNRAVAEYFGRIVSSAVLGVSIVIAAAVLGGILAGLHG